MITNLDLMEVNRAGRRYAGRGEVEYLALAAEYLALCVSDHERTRVEYHWNDGCRDYAADMGHLARLDAELQSAAKLLG